MAKEFGKYSKDHLKRIYAQFHDFNNQAADLQTMLEENEELASLLPSWAHLYDQSFIKLVAILIWFFEWQEPLEEANASCDATESWLNYSDQALAELDDEIETLSASEEAALKESMPFLLTLIMAIKGNITALKQRHRTICDMMAELKTGGVKGDDSLFEAITIDRTVITCQTAAARIARAEATGDQKFMTRLDKALRGVKPKATDREHDDFRYMLEALNDGMGSEQLTAAKVEEILCHELELYTSDFESLKKMLQKRSKIVGK